jgi:hypothetical protein
VNRLININQLRNEMININQLRNGVHVVACLCVLRKLMSTTCCVAARTGGVTATGLATDTGAADDGGGDGTNMLRNSLVARKELPLMVLRGCPDGKASEGEVGSPSLCGIACWVLTEGAFSPAFCSAELHNVSSTSSSLVPD